MLAPAPTGGLESVLRALGTGLRDRGHRVTIAAVIEPGRGPHPFVQETRAAGLEVRVIEVGARSYLSERRELSRLREEVDAGILHTHGYRPDVIDAGVGRRAGIPVVSTVHGFTGGGIRNRLYERVQLRAFRRFDAVVAVSPPLERTLLEAGLPRSRVHLIPNAWAAETPLPRNEARRRLGLPETGRVVGWVGRLSAEKAPDLAVRAFARVEGPAVLVFLGDGPERAPAEALAGELNVSERVRWLGNVPGAGRLLAAFDLLVLSSRTEGTPMVLFEAMAACVPVVATGVGGVPAALARGGGEVVEPESPGALAGAISAILRGERRPTLPDAEAVLGRDRREWVGRYEAVYAGVLAGRAAA